MLVHFSFLDVSYFRATVHTIQGGGIAFTSSNVCSFYLTSVYATTVWICKGFAQKYIFLFESELVLNSSSLLRMIQYGWMYACKCGQSAANTVREMGSIIWVILVDSMIVCVRQSGGGKKCKAIFLSHNNDTNDCKHEEKFYQLE